MRDAAFMLLGDPRVPSSRPNLFGELMKFILPRQAVEEAVNWVLNGAPNPRYTFQKKAIMDLFRTVFYWLLVVSMITSPAMR